jgi:hypothetical protein
MSVVCCLWVADSNQVLVYDTEERVWGGIEASAADPDLLGPNGECGEQIDYTQ